MFKLNSLGILIFIIGLGLFLIAVFFKGDKKEDSSANQRDYSGAFEFGGITRKYHIHLPLSYDGQNPAPLLLVFHGAGGSGKEMKMWTELDDIADRERFIVVYPEGYMATWADGSGATPAGRVGVDDVGFVSALIDKIAKELKVDPSRVYATGFSNGGMLSHRLGCELSHKVAAIASVGGTMVKRLSSRCNPGRAVPVMLIHGTQDVVVPWKGGEVQGIGISGWKILSVNATAERWADMNGCSPTPKVSNRLGNAEDGMLLLYRLYNKCRDNVEVVLYAFKDGGHTWPKGVELQESAFGNTKRDVDAGEVIWDFFERHPKK
ncbi:MAG TPA: PHB depolymerase family esterase [Thermodesulfobacteriota bacterium]|nr:PHB depolymerase family esterase [Thermodesulfobacteriota bacterium]